MTRLLLFALVALAACSSTDPATLRQASCRRVLESQVEAWNRADLDSFADTYLRSPDTVFATPSEVALGWDAMRERYRRAYPDAASMGSLRFRALSLRPFGQDAMTARGAWEITSENEIRWGEFLLVLRHVEAGWKIVLDYTTSEGFAPVPSQP